MEKESDSVSSGMDGIADMTQSKDTNQSGLEKESGEVPMEEDNAGQEEVVFGPACTFGILLQNSKLDPMCGGTVELLSSLKKKEQLNLLNRSGQYDLEDSSNLAVCEDHKNMLGGFRFTHKYVNNPKCLWSNHYGDFVPANKGEKRKKNQKKIRFRNKCISAEECKFGSVLSPS